jgi:hypothetical protein
LKRFNPLIVSIACFPRSAHGIEAERANWRLIARGKGIHWPGLDENISIESFLAEPAIR